MTQDAHATGKQAQASGQSTSQAQAASSGKKKRYYEDDGSDNDEVYSALLNTQKPDLTLGGKKVSHEQAHHSYQSGSFKADSEVKTGLKPQTSGSSRATHGGHHAQDKTEITPPPGIDQKTEVARNEPHSHHSAPERDSRTQTGATKNRDRSDVHVSSHQSNGYHAKEADHKDHKDQLDSKPAHGSHSQSHVVSQIHGQTPSGHSNLMFSPQISALPQVPTFFMAQNVTTVAQDGTQSQQLMLVPMAMMQAPAPGNTAGVSQGSHTAGVPAGAPFMFAPHPASTSRSGHPADAHHATGGQAHAQTQAASIYCLVPIHTLPFHQPLSN